jgi:hypothetical protein
MEALIAERGIKFGNRKAYTRAGRGLDPSAGHDEPIQRESPCLEHDPEKWNPVFGKDHAQTKKLNHDSINSGHGLAAQHGSKFRRKSLSCLRLRALYDRVVTQKSMDAADPINHLGDAQVHDKTGKRQGLAW